MDIGDFVDSLVDGEWQNVDSREAITAEVEALIEELEDESIVREIVRNIVEAMNLEHST